MWLRISTRKLVDGSNQLLCRRKIICTRTVWKLLHNPATMTLQNNFSFTSLNRYVFQARLHSKTEDQTNNLFSCRVYLLLQGKKECFATCLFVCYDLIRPDVALEHAWINNMLDFAFPYLLQVTYPPNYSKRRSFSFS